MTRRVAVRASAELLGAASLALTLADLANRSMARGRVPNNQPTSRRRGAAQRIRAMPPMAWRCLRTPGDLVRWIDQSAPASRKLCAAPVQRCPVSSTLAGVVTTEAPANHHTAVTAVQQRTDRLAAMYVLDGKPFGPDCICKVDPMGDAEIVELATWLAAEDAVTPVTKHGDHRRDLRHRQR